MKTIKAILAVLTFALLAASSYAQKIDVSGGYAFLHLNGSSGVSGVNLNGFDASLGVHANSIFGVVADFGVYHGSPSGVGVTAESYTFGPRITVPHIPKVKPFVEGLVGGSHISAGVGGFSGSANPFAFGFGGGADFSVAPRIAFRPQYDYFGFHTNGVTENSSRLAISLVLKL
jgi:opacity protein-like surface antigen